MAETYLFMNRKQLSVATFRKALVLFSLMLCSCAFSQIRRNLNDLSPAKCTELVNLMQEYITKDVIENHCSSLSDGHTMDIHNDDNFLPFHRCYIEAMEDFMMKKGHPEFVPLPAWPPNTTVPTEFRVVDADCPSAVCNINVSTNSATNCNSNMNWNPNISRPAYLSLPIASGSNNDLCDFISAANSNNSITRILEGQSPNVVSSNYHNSVHNAMGGAMGFFTSPAAPIFWCFHAYVDDIWKEFQCGCPNKGGKAIDLYMKDSPRVTAVTRDIGIEPNSDQGAMTNSPDIWVRNQNDGKTNSVHQNPIYSTLNFVYVRVRNRGCQTSATEKLILHWSKGATSQTWPTYWNGSIKTPALMGDTLAIVNIPPIIAGGSTILEVQWFPPNSTNYSSNSTPKLFTIIARIVSANDPMTTAEGADVAVNTRNNNNIVMKNITVDSPPNVFPFVNITEPVGGAQFIAPSPINIKANASDNDGNISKVEFYNGSTLLGTATSSPFVYTWTNAAPGSYTLTAKAYDDLNASTTSSGVAITVKANTAPVVSISSPVEGAVFIEPPVITLTATASDPDGSISKVEFYNGATLLGTAASAPYTFNWNNASAGTYTLTAKAYDDLNATTSSTAVNITVKANQLPAVSIFSPSDGTALIAPATVIIKANASDNDGTISKVEFYNGSSLLGTTTASPYAISLTAPPSGVYTLTAKAYDDLNGVKTSAVVTLTVKDNTAPSVSLIFPSDGTILIAPASVTLKANATDTDGSITKVSFYEGSTLLGEVFNSPFTFDWNNVPAGTYTVTAKATDNLQAVTTSASITLTVKNNSAPAVSITSPSDGTPLIAPASLIIKAVASDSDGSISKVEFYEGSTMLGNLTNSPYTFNWNNVPVGIYALTVKAYDDLNAVTTSSVVHVTVNNNNPPVVSLTSPSDGLSFIAPATVVIKANASDSDGMISKIEFYNGATLLSTSTASPYTFNWTSVPAGTYALTAKAYDDLNASTTSASVTIQVHENALPSVNITAPANGTTAIAPANVVIKASASDSDGNISKVEFYEGSTLLGTVATPPYTVNWSNVGSGSYSLTAKAYDDLNAVKTSSPVNITINTNALPVVTVTSPVTGSTAIAPATVTIKATATDSDGSIAKVEFFNGSALLGEDLTSPYSFDLSNVSPGNYLLSAKAYDDLGASSASNDVALTVNSNNLPIVALTDPLNGKTFTAPANIVIKTDASDSDGTISKVEFYNGSTLLGEDLTFPYSFSWNAVPAGTYTLSAKAYDNLNAVTTSSPIAITVNANSLPVVQITEPSNGASFVSPASFVIKASASDSDGSISKVEFYNGSTLLSTAAASPYTFNWDNVGAGTYTLTTKAYDNLNAVTVSSAVTVTVAGNQLPLVEITYPSNNEIFLSPTNITIEANASDGDGSISKVEFYEGSTLLGTDATAPYTYDWISVSEGIYHLTAKAYDNVNAVSTSTAVKIVVDSNSPPMVNITSPQDGAILLSPATLNIEADASDPDGTISKIEFYNGTTLLGSDNSNPFSYTWANVPIGNYHIIAKAFDDLGTFTFSDTVQFSVISNDAPLVSIIDPVAGSTLIAPANTVIKVNATDTDGTITKVEFYEGSALLGEDLTSPYTFTWNNVASGSYTLTAKAYDNFNVSTASTAVSVTVKDNSFPDVTITSPTTGTVLIAPANLLIKANASDTDGNITKVEFYQGSILLGADLTSPFTFDWNGIPEGSYALTAKAYDEQNASTTSSSVNLVVNANQPPMVTITSPPNGNTFITPANITIKANAGDNDGSISKVEFYDGSTLLGISTVSPYTYDWLGISTGTYTITAKAYDDLNLSTTSAAVTLTVKDNSTPTVALTSPGNGSSVIAPANVIVRATANDSDGSISKVEFYNGSTLLGTAITSPYSFAWNTVPAGVYTLTAKAYDDLNAAETSSPVTFSVKDNSLPTVVIASPLNGATGIAPAFMSIKANANDSDGNISKVEFYNGSTLIGTSATVPYTFDWSNVLAGSYTLTAKAYDDLNAVQTSSPVTIVIKDNAAPSISITDPLTGITEISPVNFVLQAQAMDSDGSIAKVEFYEGSTLLGTDSNAPFTFNWNNVPAGSYVITAKAYDDLNAVSVSQEVKITVRNNEPPVIAIVNPVNGTTVIAPANIAIKANASDADGGISKVEFYEGANLLYTDVSSPYAYDWNNVQTGVYLLTARAYDNLNALTTSAEIKVTVNTNLPPVVHILSPVNGTAVIEPGTVMLKASATDNDGSISKVEFYDGNSLLATVTNGPYTFEWNSIPAGVYNLTAKAYDNLNATAVSSEVKLTVNTNSAPVVNLTSPATQSTFLAPANVVIKGNAYDSDGEIVKIEFYEGSTLLGTDASSPYQFDWNAVPAGDYVLTLKAYDNLNGITTSDNVTVHVLNNTLPVVRITSPANDAMFMPPADMDITASASDANGSISKVEFYNGGSLIGTVTTSPYTFHWTNVPIGEYHLVAKAYDDLNAFSTSDTVRVIVHDNMKPMIMITKPYDDDYFNLPVDVMILAHATDDDGMIMKVEFYQNGIFLGEDHLSPYEYEWKNVPAGDYELTAVAFDDMGATDTSMIIKFKVDSNILPITEITNPVNGDVFSAFTDIAITAEASDITGSVKWVDFYQDGNLVDSDSTDPYQVTWKNVAEGTYTLVAEAHDDQNGRGYSDDVHITVVNNPAPTVSITGPSNGDNFISGDSIDIHATAQDDGSIQRVDFYRGKVLIASDSTAPYTCTWQHAAQGHHALTAKAYDNLGIAAVSSKVNITVKDNAAPTVVLISPVNNTIYTAPTNVWLEADAQDMDGSVSYVRFYVDATLIASDSTSPYTFSWKNAGTGTYVITAKAFDNRNAFTESSSSTIKIENNQLPTVSITLPKDGDTFTAPAAITIEAIAQDVNGSISRVDFFRGNALIGSDSTQPYSYVWKNVPAGSYILTAKAYDNLNAINTSAEIKVTVKDIPTSIDQKAYELTDVVLYPVPFDSRVTLKFSTSLPATVLIKLYNETGKEMLMIHKKVNPGEQLLEMDTSQLPSGLYFLILQTDKQLLKQKLLKIDSN